METPKKISRTDLKKSQMGTLGRFAADNLYLEEETASENKKLRFG